MYQCFLYMRDPGDPSNLDSNHYAFPLTISPVVDTVTAKVIRIDFLPTGSDHSVEEPQPLSIPPPSEYTPEHQDLRTDVKPLHVIQPEGASFKVTELGETGRVLEWQKWFFRIGFNQREGMVLYDVRCTPNSMGRSAYIFRSATMIEISSIVWRCQTWSSPIPTRGTLSIRRQHSTSATPAQVSWPIILSLDVTVLGPFITSVPCSTQIKVIPGPWRTWFVFTSRTLALGGNTPIIEPVRPPLSVVESSWYNPSSLLLITSTSWPSYSTKLAR